MDRNRDQVDDRDPRKDKVGTGDPRLDEEAQGGTRIPGTPGYESEAAFRHRERADADQLEIRPNQLIRGTLREETDEPTFESTTMKWNEDTHHESR